MATALDKKADLAGPGVSTYEEVEKIRPTEYRSVLDPKETQHALFHLKRYIEDNLCKELNLFHIEVPLIVTKVSGVNDYLDRDGSRTPIDFPCGLGLEMRMECQVVQAATKWKRMALRQFEYGVGEGICTDMRAVRKDYFLDHDHSAYGPALRSGGEVSCGSERLLANGPGSDPPWGLTPLGSASSRAGARSQCARHGPELAA